MQQYCLRRSIALALTLIFFHAPVNAVESCDISRVIIQDDTIAECSSDGNLLVTGSWTDAVANDESILNKTMEILQPKIAESKIVVEDFRGAGDGPRVLAASVEKSTSTVAGFSIKTPIEAGTAYQSISVVLPPDSLVCGDLLFGGEVELPTKLQKSGRDVNRLSCDEPDNTSMQSKDLSWRIDLSPIDGNNGDGSEAALDFRLDKTWGYNYKAADDNLSWSENTWKLLLDGSVASDNDVFYDTLKGQFSWSYKKYKLGPQAQGAVFPVYWLSAYAGPESTLDQNDRDYVYGAKAEALLNTGGFLRSIIPGMKTNSSVRPFVSLGFEGVEPDKRDVGREPGSYQRFAGEFWWKFPITDNVILETKWQAKYILDDDDADALTVDRYTNRIDVTLSLIMGDSDDIRPFLKWSDGEQGPVFQDVQEFLIGILWELGGSSTERQ
ncbi:MAG: hypothetical protein O7G86_19315 [Gammaproteobacteria bacterium]|nr:hypothetical protein [Gammaproteobacteria bacterium]